MSLLIQDTADLVVTGQPATNGTVVNEWRVQFGGNNACVGWLWNGSTWVGYPLSRLIYAGDPNGQVTCTVAGQICLNTSASQEYQGTIGTTTWTAIV